MSVQLKLFEGAGGKPVRKKCERKREAIRELIPAWRKTKVKLEGSVKKVNSSQSAAELLKSLIGDDPYENFWTIFLDGGNNIIGVELVDRGTVTQATPPIRNVFAGALLSCAAAIVCGHNHPSGDTSPSEGDKEFTKSLSQAGEALSLKVLDHIIVSSSAFDGGNDGYYSFADEGLL